MLAYNILGNNIQQARLRRGLTQEQVAVKLGLTQNHYGRFERGEIRPNIDRLFQICEILEILDYQALIIGIKYTDTIFIHEKTPLPLKICPTYVSQPCIRG